MKNNLYKSLFGGAIIITLILSCLRTDIRRGDIVSQII